MNEHNNVTCADPHDMAAELAPGVLTGPERAVAITHPEKREANREDVRQLTATAVGLPPAEPPAGFGTRVLEWLCPGHGDTTL